MENLSCVLCPPVFLTPYFGFVSTHCTNVAVFASLSFLPFVASAPMLQLLQLIYYFYMLLTQLIDFLEVKKKNQYSHVFVVKMNSLSQ